MEVVGHIIPDMLQGAPVFEWHGLCDVAATADVHKHLIELAAKAAMMMFCCRMLQLHMGTTTWD
jgi:hypothetical protein